MDIGVLAVAKAYLVLGLAVACFALYAISLDPATFQQLQLQIIKDSGDQPEQGQTDCAVTAAEVMEMRAGAVVVLLLGAAEALMATTAVVAVAWAPVLTVCAQLLSLGMATRLAGVLAGVVDLSIGRCDDQGIYRQALVFGYFAVTVSFGLLFIIGLLIALFDGHGIYRQARRILGIIKDSGDQPEQGQTDCAVTAAEVMEMRAGAVVVLLLGAAEALMATTAVVAVAWAPVLTVCAQLLSLGMATRLAGVLAGVVDLSIGRCDDQGIYRQALVFGYFAVTVSFGLLFIIGLLIALFDGHGIYRQARRILGIIKDSGDQPEQGQTDCAVTAAEVMEMRAGAVVVLLLGAAEALMATTAVVAVAWAPVLTVCAQLLSLGMATRLAGVLAGVVDLSIGRCDDQGIYRQALVFGYFAVTVSFGLLFIIGLLIALFDGHGIYRQARRILGIIKDSGDQPEQGQTDCAVTAAEVMEMRAGAVVVLLLGAAEALMATTAVVAVAWAPVLTVCAQLLSLGMATRLAGVLAGVVDLSIGRCDDQGIYRQALVFGYFAVTVSFGLLFIIGLLIALFDGHGIYRQARRILGIIKDSGDQPEQGQTDCAVTAAEVMEMRAGAVVVLLLGAAEALMATTAVVAVAWAPVLTVCAQLLSLGMATRLAGVLAGVVDLSIGRCDDQGIYRQALVFGYFAVTVSFGLLFIIGLLIALFDGHGIYRQARRILGVSD